MSSTISLQDGRTSVNHNTRRVWAAVTREPNIRIRALAERLGVSTSVIGYQLRRLRAAGYITFADNTTGTRQVIVPFITLGAEPA